MSNQKVTIKGKVYDLADTADLVSIQNALVPDNWPGKKADGVRHFLAIQEMLGFQIKRYVAARYKNIAKAALEEGEEGGAAKMGVSFSFEIDFTSPLVAALTKMKLSFSVRNVLEGKPQTVDLTQSNFYDKLDEDMGKVLDTGLVEREVAEADAEKADEKKAKAEAKKGAGKVEKFPPTPDESQTPPPPPSGVDKKPRSRKT
jgi:hypothetical protein